jgi:hypothetical protein
MRTNRIEYPLFGHSRSLPTMTVDSVEEFIVEVRGAFDDVEDISAVPTSFTSACDGASAGADSPPDCRARRQAPAIALRSTVVPRASAPTLDRTGGGPQQPHC